MCTYHYHNYISITLINLSQWSTVSTWVGNSKQTRGRLSLGLLGDITMIKGGIFGEHIQASRGALNGEINVNNLKPLRGTLILQFNADSRKLAAVLTWATNDHQLLPMLLLLYVIGVFISRHVKNRCLCRKRRNDVYGCTTSPWK